MLHLSDAETGECIEGLVVRFTVRVGPVVDEEVDAEVVLEGVGHRAHDERVPGLVLQPEPIVCVVDPERVIVRHHLLGR